MSPSGTGGISPSSDDIMYGNMYGPDGFEPYSEASTETENSHSTTSYVERVIETADRAGVQLSWIEQEEQDER